MKVRKLLALMLVMAMALTIIPSAASAAKLVVFDIGDEKLFSINIEDGQLSNQTVEDNVDPATIALSSDSAKYFEIANITLRVGAQSGNTIDVTLRAVKAVACQECIVNFKQYDGEAWTPKYSSMLTSVVNACYLDLEEEDDQYQSSRTIDQNYTLTQSGDATYTDVTKVRLEWTLPEISVSYTSNKTWDPDSLQWVESKTVSTIGEKTATFKFTNYSSVKVGAQVSFAKAIGTDSNPYKSDVLTLDTAVAPDGDREVLYAAPTGTIKHIYTPVASEFSSLSAGTGKYGTYTVKLLNTVKVTFNVGDHGEAVDAQVLGAGSKVTQPTVAEANGEYRFKGWYTSDSYETKWDFAKDTVTADTIIYGLWQSPE